MVESNQRDVRKDVPSCPAMVGIDLASCPPSSRESEDKPGKRNPQHSQTKEFVVYTTEPISPRMREMLEGLDQPGDCGNPPDPPPWLDRDLFDRGCKFYQKYLFPLSFSDLLSLIIMFSNPRALNPLIFTGRSDTPEKALKRYFSTLLHLMTWYTGDIWNPNDQAHKDVMSIRKVHNKFAKLFNSSYNNDRVKRTTVNDKGHEESSCPFYTSIKDDMKCYAEENQDILMLNGSITFISQFDMSLTQYSFMGLLLAHPSKLGAGSATDEEFKALIHFWRGMGWLLGIDDKYNFCKGSLSETRALCSELERSFAVPMLSKTNWSHEHMSSCLINGIATEIPCASFPAMFRYLADLLQVSVPGFVSQMTFTQVIHYWVLRIGFALMVIFPGLSFYITKCFKQLIEQKKMKTVQSNALDLQNTTTR